MRTTLAALLAGALGTGLTAIPVKAEAAEGSVTIHARANEQASYDIYQVFTADISDDDVAMHIAWNGDNREVVLTFLDQDASVTGASIGYADWLASRELTDANAHDNAQNAAEYLSLMIAESSDGVAITTPAPKEAGTFAENFGQYLASAGTKATPGTATSGSPYRNEEGYYLAVSSTSTIGADESGTAPMWIPLGGSMQIIDAKEAAPTLQFHVLEDRAGSDWGKAADSCKGQDLPFRVCGSLPTNVSSYDVFHDCYTIALPMGMTLASGDSSSVIVTLNGYDVTDQVDVAYEGNVLTVEADDLKALVRHQTQYVYEDSAGQELTTLVPLPEQFPGTDYPFAQDGERYRAIREQMVSSDIIAPLYSGRGIEITYSAHLNAAAVQGEDANYTTVERAYTADPVSLEDRQATRQTVANYAYETQLVKVDKANGQALAGAQYTFRVSDGTALNKDGSPTLQEPEANTDSASAGHYLQADGSLGSEPYVFETNAQGELRVPTIDEGVYIVREITAPERYDLQDTDIVLVVTSELDQDTGELVSFAAQVSGGEARDVDGDEMTRLISAEKPAGVARMQAVDDRLMELASTGLYGNGLLFVVAGVLAGAGTTGLAAAGRKHDGRR